MKTKQQTGVAAVYVKNKKPLELRKYPLLPPEPGHALLKLHTSGICGTDIHILEGRLLIQPPFIPGHEFTGCIEALGAKARTDGLGSPLKKGDAVIACVALPCGKCFCCKQGETASCLQFGVSNIRNPDEPPHFFGGFAEYLHQPAKTLVKIPKGINLKAAAAMPCAGPTILRALDFAGGLKRGELVVVQGTGPVGLFAVAFAASAGCVVVAVGSGSIPQRLKAAKQLGAKLVMDYRQMPAATRLKKIQALAASLNRGNGADVVIEASGSPTAIPEGMNLLRTLGRYVVPGQYSSSGLVPIQPELITFKALKIFGSAQYKMKDIAEYLAFLKRNPKIAKTFANLTKSFPLRQALQAVHEASSGKTVKAVLIR